MVYPGTNFIQRSKSILLQILINQLFCVAQGKNVPIYQRNIFRPRDSLPLEFGLTEPSLYLIAKDLEGMP